jgi:2-polyprenyl-6-methoxyphenol hydroxylase-like FAD-dependent oxidoreductase
VTDVTDVTVKPANPDDNGARSWPSASRTAGVADAMNLSWKLAAVLHGWGHPNLLDSYDIERRPVCYRAMEEAVAELDPRPVMRRKSSFRRATFPIPSSVMRSTWFCGTRMFLHHEPSSKRPRDFTRDNPPSRYYPLRRLPGLPVRNNLIRQPSPIRVRPLRLHPSR